jgi:hypothetical protein
MILLKMIWSESYEKREREREREDHPNFSNLETLIIYSLYIIVNSISHISSWSLVWVILKKKMKKKKKNLNLKNWDFFKNIFFLSHNSPLPWQKRC